MTHRHAKDEGKTSLGSKVRVETDGRTDAIALSPVLTWSVKKLVTVHEVNKLRYLEKLRTVFCYFWR